MRKTILFFAFFIIYSISIYGQSAFLFKDLLKKLDSTPIEKKAELIEGFIAENGRTPIVEGSLVTFLAKGDKPYLLADFNGFLHPRYVPEKEKGKMIEIEGTTWNYFQIEVSEKAAINYKFMVGGNRDDRPIKS